MRLRNLCTCRRGATGRAPDVMSLKVFARRNVPANKGIPLLRVYSVCVLDRMSH